MDRSNHYEVAFEAYLSRHGLCYIAVDETRRALWSGEPVKSLDFLVFGPSGARLVVDIKGRRFPGGTPKKPRRVWESWSAREDVDGLVRWAYLAGEGWRGLLVFAYELHPSIELPPTTPDLWTSRGKRYLFRAVDIDEYKVYMRVRSPRWGTVSLPRDLFRSLVRPLSDFTKLTTAAPELQGCPF